MPKTFVFTRTAGSQRLDGRFDLLLNIDCARVRSIDQLHSFFALQLHFIEDYGNNLDALMDMLRYPPDEYTGAVFVFSNADQI